MRQLKPCLILTGIAFLLVACGGGGGSGSSSSSGGANNVAPVANAGPAQTVNAGATVTLNGSASSDSDGSVAAYAWSQTGGATVSLSNASAVQPTFPAPVSAAVATLTFSLVVTDNLGARSTASTDNITVNPVVNVAPTANAGASQTVGAAELVTLSGSASSDPDGSIASYAWTQTAGMAVTLLTASDAMPTFVAPLVSATTTLTFSLLVTDNQGASSGAATVNVTVDPLAASTSVVNGRVTFGRVRFASGNTNSGLDYGSPVQQPARRVVVQAIASPTGTMVASGTTDDDGNYSLVVPNNTSMVIQILARMQRDGAAPLPHWNTEVKNGVTATSPYGYSDNATFNSGTGTTTRNFAIPTAISASGTLQGTARHSGPFAILDTIYTSMQAVLRVAPTTSFPALYVDWGAQADGTFFTRANGAHIALLSDLTEDTDEFDQHVIAHEFGHYVESYFSRSDSIGGPHSLGERLDPRVAFGEGFGYAFAAIVLDDPLARDSFVNTSGQFVSSGFNVEANPAGTNGCWCSESSVFSILYDLYDDAPDANDNVALGFQPLWNVLADSQRTTPAFTTIFSFISALKAEQPASTNAINTLVAAQNIDASNIDLFASTETHFPPNVTQPGALPVYTNATIGAAIPALRSVNDAGYANKLSNRRFVRFDVASTRNVTITLSTSNPSANRDPDFLVWKNGDFIRDGTDPPTEYPETETFQVTPGTYVVEIYDCANGCLPPEPADGPGSGDYDLTLPTN